MIVHLDTALYINTRNIETVRVHALGGDDPDVTYYVEIRMVSGDEVEYPSAEGQCWDDIDQVHRWIAEKLLVN